MGIEIERGSCVGRRKWSTGSGCIGLGSCGPERCAEVALYRLHAVARQSAIHGQIGKARRGRPVSIPLLSSWSVVLLMSSCRGSRRGPRIVATHAQ